MKRTTPPFRADHVGSYLRSAAITEARAKRDKGQISAADLKKIEDQEIPKVIRKQEEVGLQCASGPEIKAGFRFGGAHGTLPVSAALGPVMRLMASMLISIVPVALPKSAVCSEAE